MTIGAIRLNKTEIETQQNSCAGVAFPRRAAARDAPAVWCFLPPGRVEEVPLLVLEPSARTNRRMAATNNVVCLGLVDL